jgi:CRP-like cAMP-binding protein
VAAICGYGQVEDVEAGQVLFDADDLERDFFLVLSGRVDILAPSGGERTDGVPEHAAAEVVIVKTSGTFIGDLGLLTRQRSGLRARVTEHARLCRLSSRQLRELITNETGLAALLWTALAERRNRLTRSAAATVEVFSATHDPDGTGVRELLGMAGVPHTWVDPELAEGVRRRVRLGVSSADLPAVALNDRVLRKRHLRDRG